MIVKTDWRSALMGVLIPHVPSTRVGWTMVVAVFGTTISPYLFFWQAATEAEDELLLDDPRPLREHTDDAPGEMQRIGWDTWTGMIYSNFVALAIIWGAASTLHAHGILDIETAAQAASALGPVAGPYAMYLFGFGIVGTGLLAVPVLAGSVAYSVGEVRGWHVGLNRKARDAVAFYVILAASTFIGLLLALSPADPMRALVAAAVVNGVIAVPLIVIITVLGMRQSVMGDLTLPRWLVVGGFASAVLMGVASLAMVLL
jgi:Mn2+/Fe2+ NRAMP family transporter